MVKVQSVHELVVAINKGATFKRLIDGRYYDVSVADLIRWSFGEVIILVREGRLFYSMEL